MDSTAFASTRRYAGKTLSEHFGELVNMADADLQRESANFLKLMATWVWRKFNDRRKGGIPLGHLSSFVHPDNVKIDFTRALMLHVVRILRKRGLRDYDLAKKSPPFDELLRAFEKTPKEVRQ